jgi:FKBP-type peptidyl-prolyl cis-trans isomerase
MAGCPFFSMKNAPLIMALACVFGLGSAEAQDTPSTPAPASESAPAAAPAAPAVAAGPTDDQLVEEFGWFLGMRVGLNGLNFNDEQVQSLLKGVTEAAAGKESPYDLQKIGPAMDSLLEKKKALAMSKLREQSQAASASFFAKLKDDKSVVQTPSGLCYEIVSQGDGPSPKATDTVKVDYTGTLLDGTVFDTSLQPRQPGGTAAPAELRLDQTIPGWTEGVQKIGKGGEIKLYIPANLAYGDEGRQNIPPGSALIFDVKLIDIKAAAPVSAVAPADTGAK